MDEAGNVYDPSLMQSMSMTPLGEAVGGAYDAVTGGIGDYFDGVSRRFDNATGNGTPSAVPSGAIGNIPSPKSIKDDKLESNVNVIVNNNADGNEVNVDDNGDESTFFNWFTK